MLQVSPPVTAASSIVTLPKSCQDLLRTFMFLHDNDKYTIPLGPAAFRTTYGSRPLT